MGIYYGHGVLDAEVRGQGAEDKGQRTEVRGQKSWILNRRTAEQGTAECRSV
jgi:hypothetical protein